MIKINKVRLPYLKCFNQGASSDKNDKIKKKKFMRLCMCVCEGCVCVC